jgi:hypothetical protein
MYTQSIYMYVYIYLYTVRRREAKGAVGVGGIIGAIDTLYRYVCVCVCI